MLHRGCVHLIEGNGAVVSVAEQHRIRRPTHKPGVRKRSQEFGAWGHGVSWRTRSVNNDGLSSALSLREVKTTAQDFFCL